MIWDIQSLPNGIPFDLPKGEVAISFIKGKEADNDIGPFGKLWEVQFHS